MTSNVLLPSPIVITDHRSWQDCADILSAESRLAIDLEANSLYAYKERICLIQISVPNHDFIVDPLAPIDLSALGQILRDPSKEKVFHAAEYDLILLKRQHGWRLNYLFDTLWAARILGYKKYGLANLLETFYGIRHSKKHQKTNWCRRPLSADQLSYAQRDTHFLLQLRDDLARELRQQNRMAEAQESFLEQTKVRVPSTSFNADDFWNINGVKKLSGYQRAVAKALFSYRDQQAKKQDRPPFKIFQDRTLLEIASAVPQNKQELSAVHGMSDGQVRRYGRSILRIIERAKKDPVPKPPNKKNNRPPEEVRNRYEQLRNWRKNTAQDRGVESDVILSRSVMWSIARANPKSTSELSQVDALGDWRLQVYGQDIVEAINDSR